MSSVKDIKLLCIIASMPGLERLLKECPGLEVWVAACDQELTDKGYITPCVSLCAPLTEVDLPHSGLGDAGDRYFGTPPSH